MGFKRPKSKRIHKDPSEDDKVERDLDPTKILLGGSKVAKKGNRNTSDAPKSFQRVMQFMDMMDKRNKSKIEQKKKRKEKQQQQQKNNAKDSTKKKEITSDLKIMPGESFKEFNRRVKKKMENNLSIVGTADAVQDKHNDNPARDEGESPAVVSKRSDRKKRNDAIRKERKRVKKSKRGSDDDSDDGGRDSKHTATANQPKFGEQADAPPIFKALPKQKIKKMIPLPASKEEAEDKKRRDELAVKKMIQRTSRLSPLERMQAKRKAKLQGDTAAEKRIMDAEREKAIRRYRMLKAVKDSHNNTLQNAQPQ